MNNAIPIDPRRAVIIGAGPNLGASIARRFGREGFSLTLVGRDEHALAGLAGDLRATGVTVETAAADAADLNSFRTAMESLTTTSAPGVVIYNAAVLRADNILTVDSDSLQSTFATNTLAAVVAAQVFTPAMRQAGAGTFLVSGGYAGISPRPPYATLSLGKAGVRVIVALMHDELKADGVQATGITIGGAIAPGTPFDPDIIADTYYHLHTQPAADWTDELHFDGK